MSTDYPDKMGVSRPITPPENWNRAGYSLSAQELACEGIEGGLMHMYIACSVTLFFCISDEVREKVTGRPLGLRGFECADKSASLKETS